MQLEGTELFFKDARIRGIQEMPEVLKPYLQ